MNRRIFFIILGALVVLALMVFLWFWFFGRDSGDIVDNTGSLGSSDTRPGGSGSGGTGGNTQTPIGSNTGTQGGSGSGSGTNTSVSIYTYTSGSTTITFTTPSGAVWLDGVGGGGSTNRLFIPTPINQLNSVNLSGIGNIGEEGGGTGGLGLGGALIGAGIAGVVSCSAFLVNPAGAATPLALFTVQVNAPAENSNEIMDCMTRVIAKIALQQITVSVVDWINSGFNGRPTFVQNYEQFFTDIADRAAGEFIQGSGLAFLCSPFKLQIKIAIAQSYANRKSSSAGSCTLSQVVGNIEQFMNGDFSQGGWPGLISFTTMPTNNPYGAYMYAEIALNNQIRISTAEASRGLSEGGFISTTEEYNCQTRQVGGRTERYNCQTRIVTPGTVIEGNLRKVMEIPIEENLLADSFDEIISALMNQLMTKMLYGGLANLGRNGLSGAQRGIDAAQTLLTNLQGAVQLAQQYGGAKQGSVADIQAAQAQLNTLSNCWNTAASSTSISSGQQTQALQNAANADASIAALETRVTLYNTDITRANAAVAIVQQLQTDALLATTLSEVEDVQDDFDSARTAGALVTQTDVVSAQQDRQTLQSEMNGVNQGTAAQLTQCYAFQ